MHASLYWRRRLAAAGWRVETSVALLENKWYPRGNPTSVSRSVSFCKLYRLTKINLVNFDISDFAVRVASN